MECCVSVCQGSFATTPPHKRNRARRLHRHSETAPCLRITATTTFPGKNQGSSRRVTFREPQRLLQTENFHLTQQSDGPSTSGRGDLEAEYVVEVTTSNEDRAGLSVPDAGVMLSLIGEGGEALVRRILPVEEDGGSLRFQRGALDVVRFRGPDVGRISALWIAPEAGTWQLEQVTVTTMLQGESVAKGLRYVFNAWDVVLGDGEDTPAAELTPSQILDYDGSAILASNELPKTPQDSAKMREASMREYEALKLFLLGSTASMVGVGTLGLFLLGAPDMAQGFAVGGAGGLVYLLFIQRAVDQIPGPDQALRNAGNLKVKTPATSFALFVGVALVVTRASQASSVFSLPPQALLAGALGFLTSKVAVLLAAFRSDTDAK